MQEFKFMGGATEQEGVGKKLRRLTGYPNFQESYSSSVSVINK